MTNDYIRVIKINRRTIRLGVSVNEDIVGDAQALQRDTLVVDASQVTKSEYSQYLLGRISIVGLQGKYTHAGR
jgi:hypothetical protein